MLTLQTRISVSSLNVAEDVSPDRSSRLDKSVVAQVASHLKWESFYYTVSLQDTALDIYAISTIVR